MQYIHVLHRATCNEIGKDDLATSLTGLLQALWIQEKKLGIKESAASRSATMLGPSNYIGISAVTNWVN